MNTRILCGFLFFLLLFGWGTPVVSGAELTDNGNGTVTDSKTGLVWQRGEPGYMTWGNAITYCEGLSLGGADDWRLPNVKELESLTDDTRYNPALDRTYFPNANSSAYWSSTTDADDTSNAWYVYFGSGYVSYYGKSHSYYVRCVRGGQSGPLGSLMLSVTISGIGSGTVTSNPTGIACNSGTCSAEFDTASEVTLTAISDGLSTFGSWTGCTTSNDTGCAVTMDADKSIAAQFNLAPKARIGDTGYTSFSGAYSAAAASPTSTTIQLLEDTLTLGVSSINKPLVLMGGYKSDFSRTTSGVTALQGTLTIGTGSIISDRIVVK